MSKTIVVIGGGFAGLWSAIGAARLRSELEVSEQEVKIVLVDANDYHSIRVRNYERDLDDCIVPFDEILPAVNIERIKAIVEDIDVGSQTVHLASGEGKQQKQQLSYSRLVFALGSRLVHPPIPGLAEHSFDVDTHVGAAKLRQHLMRRLPDGRIQAQMGVLVVGGGLTGVEVATELASEFRRDVVDARVTICDANAQIGADMGPEAIEVIAQALQALGVTSRTALRITGIDADGAVLADGGRIDAGTVIWCAGMKAHPLAERLGVPLDNLGRLPVDQFMHVEGVKDVYAAGDAASMLLDGAHGSVMSCQHGRPMGRFAGYNVMADALGQDRLALAIDWYVTVVDLGDHGAVYTEGWDRKVVSTGSAAKAIKRIINRERIYPPRNASAEAIWAAAAPVVQAAPRRGAGSHDAQ